MSLNIRKNNSLIVGDYVIVKPKNSNECVVFKKCFLESRKINLSTINVLDVENPEMIVGNFDVKSA